LATIARIQPGLEHHGRRPQDSQTDHLAKLAKARADLQSALRIEDYEAAAVLRDQIAELEHGPTESRP
jgi:protein-arginine kinase activator protein McsA